MCQVLWIRECVSLTKEINLHNIPLSFYLRNMRAEKIEGRIVEFIEEGRFVCALCIGKKKNRLHILTSNNKEMNISSNRILFASKSLIDVSKPRPQLLEYLSNAEKERERLKEKVNVKELWELVKDEEEIFSNEYLAELAFEGEISDAHLSAVMRALFEDKLYFKLKNGLFIPNTEEQIALLIQKEEEEKRKKELIEKGSAWIKEVLEGKDVQKPDFADYVVKILSDMFLFGREAKDYEVGSEILSRVGISDLYFIKDLLVKIGVWEEDENIELIKKDIPLSFSARVKNEAKEIKEKEISLEGRRILEDLDTFTIDSEDTKDFDDALSIEIDKEKEEIVVGIHIADVSEWIPVNSAIDLEARRRGSSCYLPRRQIPMLPEELSHEFLSLKKGERRLALSLFVRIDIEGNIKDYEFVPTVIKVKKQLSYNAVNKILSEKSDEKLCELYRLAKIFREKRIKKGAVNISLPEVKILFEEGLSIKLIPQDTPAHLIVAEFMILYNWLFAKVCVENNIPILFRTQDNNIDIIPIQEGEDKIYHAIQQIRRFGPMLISTSPAPHNVLGLDVYTQATSPLRRYLDLVVQRQLKSYILKKTFPYTTKELKDIRMEVEPIVRELQAIAKSRIRYWTIKYLAQHIGEKQRAIILDELKNKYRIVLPDVLLVAEIKKKPGMIFSPGTEIWVKVKKADPWKDLIKLEYA